MLSSGTEPDSYITEYTLVYEYYLFALLEELLRGLPELLDQRLQVVDLLSGSGFRISGLEFGVRISG